ncbi:hypoxanthine phosphoribosyltransferase [bacterium SCSIO 12741]|nr:hypoxanthine phosphoribosyltransferase [bacterium SCSIO 12741]
MGTVLLGNLEFEPFIPKEEILEAITLLAEKINRDYQGRKIYFIGVLNGSFMFASDLLKQIERTCEISFVKVRSYEGTQSTGTITEELGLQESLEGKDVIVIEDIVDTGNTLEYLYGRFSELRPASLEIASLFLKPDAYHKSIPVKYVGMEIPNDFIVGYGLDYEGEGRNLKDLYKLKQ